MKAVGVVLVGFRPAHQRRADRSPFGRRDQAIAENPRLDLRHRLVRRGAQRARELVHRLRHTARRFDPAHQLVALADHLADQIAECDIGGGQHRLGQGPAERAVGLARRLQHHVEAELFEKLVLLGLVEHLEARRDIGLQRKQVQELGAEGVDGVDLQSARRLQRQREELPRALPPPGVDPLLAGLAHRLVERRVVQHRPRPQVVEHAVRHVGGGGLGEGDAEDARRIDARQQQPDHALRQDVRLARAGIRRDPGRAGRVRGRGLHLGDGIRDDARRAHSKIGSSLLAPVSDHSCTRAR